MRRQVWYGLGFLLLVGLGLALSRNTWSLTFAEQNKVAGLKQKLSGLEQERREALKREAALKSTIAREELMRAQGRRPANEFPLDP